MALQGLPGVIGPITPSPHCGPSEVMLEFWAVDFILCGVRPEAGACASSVAKDHEFPPGKVFQLPYVRVKWLRSVGPYYFTSSVDLH